VVIVSTTALATAVAGAMLAPMNRVKPLVETIAGGALDGPDPEVLLRDAKRRAAGERARQGEAIAPIATLAPDGDGSTGAQACAHAESATLELAPPPPGASVYVGTWAQESVRAEVRVRVLLTLEGDGAYTGIATILALDAPADAPPLPAIRTAGRWTVRAGSVVLARLESEDHALLPMGWREVYWDSAIDRGDWVYTDAEGLDRRLVRVRTDGLALVGG